MKRGIIDLSSLIWTSLLFGTDKEFGTKALDAKGREVTINSAQHGYDNLMGYLVNEVMKDLGLVPRQLILVKEGMNSKAGRQALLETYKAGRDKLPGQYEQFNICREMVTTALLDLGAQMCWQDGVEADDVIGYLADHLQGEVWVISGDKDLAQCVNEEAGVHQYRAGAKDENPFGPFSHHHIPVWIAMVGDSGDKIPGAKGFGQKAAEKLLMNFGEDGLELMGDLIRKRDLRALVRDGDVNEMKELQKLVDDEEGVYLSYELGRLRTDKVNTLRKPLQWQAGMVKDRSEHTEELLARYAGTKTLVCAENYDQAVDFFKKHTASTPEFALDIETSSPPESDEWMLLRDKEDAVDVFGAKLAGLSITFGRNCQHTVYLTHDHVPEEGVSNLTLEQVRDFVGMIPRERINWVHNAGFELPVLFNHWGADWSDDPLYHGFLPNVRDTLVASSYADENRSKGLKSLSHEVLGYTQTTYDEVTTKVMRKADWNGAGKVISEWTDKVPTPSGVFEQVPVLDAEGSPVIDPESGEDLLQDGPEIMTYVDGDVMVKVQFKMNELTAREVFDYGCDDTICTIGLANHFQTIMEIENTIQVFHDIETFPAYLTALGHVQGVNFSLQEMNEMEKDDEKAYNEAWTTLRQYLMGIGFEGTRCPFFETIDAAAIKAAYLILTGTELKTLVRTPSKLAKLLQQMADDAESSGVTDEDYPQMLRLLASLVEADDVKGFNDLVMANFDGEPKLDLGSPKQMKALLYDFMGLPVQIINDVTPTERQKKPELADAVKKFKQKRAGKDVTMRDHELELLKAKAKTDDTAIDYALAFDKEHISEEAQAALKAIGVMKKVMTRRNLFYANYRGLQHWKDGKIHAQANQCAAVTRRYSMSNPNLQQLPKKGEGVRFRGCFKPHDRDSVVVSIDFSGQELRLAAERSQDKNMLACYVGDNLKDIHSITAAGAMRLKWGHDKVDELNKEFGASLPMGMTREEHEYRLFLILRGLGKENPVGKMADDLRKDSKNVNFAAQFGGRAAKLSETLIMTLEDAQLFLDARAAMFPDVDVAAERAADFAKKHGYALTMMGARRHLRDAMMSDEPGAADRAARQAWNMEIQGSAGEMTKAAMTRFWKSGALFRLRARFFAPIHDELVTTVHKDDALEFIKIKHQCMVEKYASMSVPIVASISLGKDFAHQIECGDDYDPVAIQAALDSIFGANVISEERVAA